MRSAPSAQAVGPAPRIGVQEAAYEKAGGQEVKGEVIRRSRGQEVAREEGLAGRVTPVGLAPPQARQGPVRPKGTLRGAGSGAANGVEPAAAVVAVVGVAVEGASGGRISSKVGAGRTVRFVQAGTAGRGSAASTRLGTTASTRRGGAIRGAIRARSSGPPWLRRAGRRGSTQGGRPRGASCRRITP